MVVAPSVFPVYAGLTPPRQPAYTNFAPCIPRSRGVVPVTHGANGWHPHYSSHTRGCSHGPGSHVSNYFLSPRTRGCSRPRVCHGSVAGVFPALAGLFRATAKRENLEMSFPRVCGVVPISQIMPPPQVKPFPAYAGLFPCENRFLGCATSFPRMCGVVPMTVRVDRAGKRFPRACGVVFVGLVLWFVL